MLSTHCVDQADLELRFTCFCLLSARATLSFNVEWGVAGSHRCYPEKDTSRVWRNYTYRQLPQESLIFFKWVTFLLGFNSQGMKGVKTKLPTQESGRQSCPQCTLALSLFSGYMGYIQVRVLVSKAGAEKHVSCQSQANPAMNTPFFSLKYAL